MQRKATRPRSVHMRFWPRDPSPLPVRDAEQDRDSSIMRQMRMTGFHNVNVPVSATKTRGAPTGTARSD